MWSVHERLINVIAPLVADTLGIGGIFRALRTISVMQEITRDMEQVADPRVTFLNYVTKRNRKSVYEDDAGIIGASQSPLDKNGHNSLLIVCYQRQTFHCGGGMNAFIWLGHKAAVLPKMLPPGKQEGRRDFAP